MVDEVLYHARGSSPHLQPGLRVDRRQRYMGTWPRIGQSGPTGCWPWLLNKRWRGRSCTRRCHVHGVQLLPSPGVGWEGTFVKWNREEQVESEEISGGRGVPPVQTALTSPKRKLLSSFSYSITCRGTKYSARNKILLSHAVMG